MVKDAELALAKVLKRLEQQQYVVDQKIRAVKAALEALGAKNSHLRGRRLRRPMSVTERRSVSRRMKTYWAKRKVAASQ